MARPSLLHPLLRRLPLVGAIALVSAGSVLARPDAPEPSLDGVAALLARTSGTEVSAPELVWERSRGWLVDATLGRPLMFLAATAGAPRDLYRATVRVSREGRPFAVTGLHRLTDTPLGDESQLTARGPRIAFATRWDGAVQGVTVLDTRGPDTRELGLLDRVGLAWDSYRNTGSSEGIGRVELAFRRPPAEIDLQLRDGELRMAVGASRKPALLKLDELRLDTGGDPTLAAEAWRQAPEPSLWSDLRRRATAWWARVRGARQQVPPEPEAALPSPTPARGWPPPEPRGIAWSALGATPSDDPPLLQARVPSGDGEVVLVAIDTRRLDLGYRAGRRTPEPLTGPHGSGRVPAAIAPRVVGAFNGGAPTGGAVDGGRVLVPPSGDAATVGVDRHGRLRLGRLTGSPRAHDLVALRQSDGPLVEEGARPERPGGRIPRSAIGRTADGFAIYGFAARATAQELAEAMVSAGCVFALPLRLDGEGPMGLAAWPAGEPAKATLPSEAMTFEPRSVIAGADHGFFYLVAREPHPSLGALAWSPAPGRQPAPEAWPTIHVAKKESLGIEVTLHHVAPGRLSWEIRPGSKETAAQTATQRLDDEARARALFAINLGLAYRKDNRRGLVLDGVQTLPIRPFLGAIEAQEGDDLAITHTVEGLQPAGDASELPLLAEGGKIRRRSRRLGARRRRAAACTVEDGSLIIASATYDTYEPVTHTLVDLGCERVVELNRGRQIRSFVYHAGAPLDGDDSRDDDSRDDGSRDDGSRDDGSRDDGSRDDGSRDDGEPQSRNERRLEPRYLETVIFGLEAEARGRARPLSR